MGGYPEGAPCWADASLSDWRPASGSTGSSSGGPSTRTPARRGMGTTPTRTRTESRVAALQPKRDGRMPTTWTVYFATPDTRALAARIREAGGQVDHDAGAGAAARHDGGRRRPGRRRLRAVAGRAHTGFELTRGTRLVLLDRGLHPRQGPGRRVLRVRLRLPGRQRGQPRRAGRRHPHLVAARDRTRPRHRGRRPQPHVGRPSRRSCPTTSSCTSASRTATRRVAACARLGGRVTAEPFDIRTGGWPSSPTTRAPLSQSWGGQPVGT